MTATDCTARLTHSNFRAEGRMHHGIDTAIGTSRPAAPTWVLALGAALLGLALFLTAFGPRHLTPTATRAVDPAVVVDVPTAGIDRGPGGN